jgi:hypothetical protein
MPGILAECTHAGARAKEEGRRTMGIDHNIDFVLHELIEDLVHAGLIEERSPPYGVAQKVIYDGYDSLSPKQRALYDAVIVPALQKRGKELEMIRIMNSNPD